MKTMIRKICVVLMVCFLLDGMEDMTAEAAVRLNRTNVKLREEDTITLRMKGMHKRGVWKTSNRRVATVNRKGKVTAKKKGKAVITCTVEKKVYKCRVTVRRKKNTEVHAHYYEEEITREPTCSEEGEKEFICECGDSYTVEIPVKPHSAEDKYTAYVTTVTPSKAGHGYDLYHCSVCGQNFEQNRVDYNPTEEQVYNDIISLKAQYPQGMKWDETNTYKCADPTLSGRACQAFAVMISDLVFGDTPYTNISFNPQDLRTGDIVSTSYPTNHAMIVLEAHPTYMVVAEGNNGGRIVWGRIEKYSDIVSDWVIRRYPQ